MEPDKASDSGIMSQCSHISSQKRTSHTSQSVTEKSELEVIADPNFLIEHIKYLLAAKRKMKHTIDHNVSLEKSNNHLREENEKLRMELEGNKFKTTTPHCNSSENQMSFIGLEPPSSTVSFDEERNNYVQEIKNLELQLKESNSLKDSADKTVSDLEKALKTYETDSSKADEYEEGMLRELEKRREAEEIVANLKSRIEQLEAVKLRDEKYITKLEQETLEIDCLRDQLSHQSNLKATHTISQMMDKSVNTSIELTSQNIDEMRVQNRYAAPSSVEKGLIRVTELMEELYRGRLVHDLPISFQSEPPVEYQSGETFYEIVKILKMVLNRKRVTGQHLEEVWNSIPRRIKLFEDAMKEKMAAASKMAFDEFRKFQKEWQKEKEKLEAEIHNVRMENRASSNKRLEGEIKDRDNKIISLNQIISNQDETNTKLRKAYGDVNQRLKRELALAVQESASSADRKGYEELGVVQRKTSDGLTTFEDLKQKLNSIEDELVSERKSYQYAKMTLEETVIVADSLKKNLEETNAKLNYYQDLVENAIIMIMAIQESNDFETGTLGKSFEELKAILLKTDGDLGLQRPNRPLPRDMVEDKEWLLNNFFKNSY